MNWFVIQYAVEEKFGLERTRMDGYKHIGMDQDSFKTA